MTKKYLLNIWLKTFITSTISTFILVHLIEVNRDIDFRCYMPYFTELICTIISIILSFSFLTLLFNLNERIVQNKNLNLLSFFLVPAVFVLTITFIFLYQNSSDIKYLFAIIFPFLTAICFSYYNFRKLMNEKNKN